MEVRYSATAAVNGGQLTTEGTISECANWAENVIRANGGEVTVQLTRIRDGSDDKS